MNISDMRFFSARSGPLQLVVLVINLLILAIYEVNLYFRDDFVEAKESGNWRKLLDFYSLIFDSFVEVNAAFKVNGIQRV